MEGGGVQVGTSVWYVDYATDRTESHLRAATVTEVSADRADPLEVGLCIMLPTGLKFDRQVRFDPERKPGTWCFMEME